MSNINKSKMKKSIRISSLVCLTLAAMVFTFSSCDKEDDDKRPLKLSSEKVEIVVGETATVTVSNGTSPYVAASSDTEMSPTVDKSTITLKAVAKVQQPLPLRTRQEKWKNTVTVKDEES